MGSDQCHAASVNTADEVVDLGQSFLRFGTFSIELCSLVRLDHHCNHAVGLFAKVLSVVTLRSDKGNCAGDKDRHESLWATRLLASCGPREPSMFTLGAPETQLLDLSMNEIFEASTHQAMMAAAELSRAPAISPIALQSFQRRAAAIGNTAEL